MAFSGCISPSHANDSEWTSARLYVCVPSRLGARWVLTPYLLISFTFVHNHSFILFKPTKRTYGKSEVTQSHRRAGLLFAAVIISFLYILSIAFSRFLSLIVGWLVGWMELTPQVKCTIIIIIIDAVRYRKHTTRNISMRTSYECCEGTKRTTERKNETYKTWYNYFDCVA